MGMRQMVEIAKALSKDAKIVIFDEPTTSLSSQEKENLFRIIRELSEDGISMIYISHVLDDVLLLCNEIVVIRDGEVIGKQMPKSEVSKEKIISMMVGREMGQLYPYVPKEIGEEILSVENINQDKTLKNITFSIRSGEIVGLFGLMGAGRSELVRAIYGLDPIDSGSIKFMNKPVHSLNPRQWIQNGMAFITENRHEEGLLMKKSVKENLVMANLERMRLRFGYLDRKKEEVDSTNVISRLNIKTYDKDHQIVRFLSGGNQQKVVIGKWLLTTPKVFIIDEPTRGVDVGAKFEIYNHINSLVKEGSAVLFVSSEMEELMGVCDRILTMHLGRITGEVERKDFSQETLIRLAMGGVGQ
jgi:ribose transport system ATP-binding protein